MFMHFNAWQIIFIFRKMAEEEGMMGISVHSMGEVEDNVKRLQDYYSHHLG
jgi:hypothetical protein